MSTLKATNIKNESSASNNIVLDSGGGVVVSGILTATTGAGSTSAPSLSPSGDSNTGIFFPSSDTIAFSEGGAESARFDSSGRLLVGTSSASNTSALIQTTGQVIAPSGILFAHTDFSTLPNNLITTTNAADGINGHTVTLDLSTVFTPGNKQLIIQLDFIMVRSYTDSGAPQISAYSGKFYFSRNSNISYFVTRTDLSVVEMNSITNFYAGTSYTLTFNTSNVRSFQYRCASYLGGNLYPTV